MKKTSTRKKQRGQSLVEMAMFLMIILWLLAGAVDFGIAFFSYVQLRDAAQEGVIYGTTHPGSASAIADRVRHSADDRTNPTEDIWPVNLHDSDPTNGVSVVVSAPDQTPGQAISVSVSYKYYLTVPLIAPIIGRNYIPLTATATGVILKVP